MMIVRRKLSDQIYDALRQDILNQRIVFGEKMTNRELQERYNVSSSPVRDAVNRLYLEGMLTEITNSGAQVISFDYTIATEVTQVISMLNREALALSMKHADQVVCLLKQTMDLQQFCIDKDAYFEFDRQFHRIFFDFCENSRLMQLYAQHNALWSLLTHFYHADHETKRENTLAQHRNICEAYQASDVVLAQHRMEEHFHDALRPIRHILAKA